MELNSNDKTPKKLLISGLTSKKTPISTPKNFVTRFNLLANNSSLTPSPLLKTRVVRNPFENQLHDKLHLPVISSPSLFHAPLTPKQNSGKLEVFEWTIEEISNFNPVNVIPHETQFRSEDLDPEREAQVQAAISSFFNDHQIVPSPKNCALKKNKIELKNFDDHQIYNSTAIPETQGGVSSSINSNCHTNKPSDKNKREIATQTALSFPPILPKEIEDLLQRYHVSEDDSACNINSDFENTDNGDGDGGANDESMMDICTLRRKLFIKTPDSPELTFRGRCSDDAFAAHLSPAPKTPQLTKSIPILKLPSYHDGENSLSSDMFGELSPILMPVGCFDCSSPMSSPNNDISMISDVGRGTPMQRRCNKLKKKNLSESFSMLQNDDIFADKENCDLHIALPAMTERRVFARFDSGFPGDDDSNSIQNLSAELMQI